MTTEDLLSALDIAPADQGPIDLDEGPGHAPGQPAQPPSPTALVLDEWSIRRGAEASEGDVLGPILTGHDREAAEATAADCLAAAFEPNPQLAERCADETRGRYFRQLLETEEYHALHAETRLDPVASELAAGHFAQGYVALTEQEEEEPHGTPPGRPADRPEEDLRQKMKRDMRALGAAAKALESASQEVDDLRDAQRAMGMGNPEDAQRIPPSELKARFERIRDSRQLRRIMELAGRYRRLAQAKQRQKTTHGRDDVVGVTLGADLGALVPSELAALGDEDLELDAMRRFLERAMLQREYRGLEPKARGPIVVVVDESGSMRGKPVAMAKAFALAMAWIARHQHRWILLVGFSGDSEGTWCPMPPDRWDQGALLEWLEHFYSGGTTMDVPLETLPARWKELGCPEGQTDVIQITDAIVNVPDEMRERFLAWKAQAQAKYYTLVVGEDDPGDLADVSDRVWCLPDLGLENDAIQELMAL